MPTYQYACTECAERLEAVQSFSDAALTECPACGGRLRKVFSAVGVVFKGSGFYKTDSRSAKASSDGSDKGTGDKATGDKADKGSSDKPAADKGSGDKGSSGKGSGDKAAAAKAPAASASSSSSSAPAAKSA